MSKPLLLDANILIAVSFPDHVHHDRATQWFGAHPFSFATCPITQAALVRFTMRQFPGGTGVAQNLLTELTSLPNHEFWHDTLPCSSLPWQQVYGHRQVTDAYLVALAAHHNGQLATLDESLAIVFPEAILVTA